MLCASSTTGPTQALMCDPSARTSSLIHRHTDQVFVLLRSRIILFVSVQLKACHFKWLPLPTFWVCSHWTKAQILLPWVGLILSSLLANTWGNSTAPVVRIQAGRQAGPSPYRFDGKTVWRFDKSVRIPQQLLGRETWKKKLPATVMAVFIFGHGPTLLTMHVWRDDRYWPFFLMQVHGDLASLFSPSSVPLSFVGSVLCGCSGCEWVLPESVTGMLATSSPGYIKPYWCASKRLPKLADDAYAAKQ